MIGRNRHDLTSAERKLMPVHKGFLRYFPDAVLAVACLSLRANEKHNPGEELHWSKGKSSDHGDCLARHQCDVGTHDKEFDLDYAVHVAWRGMSQLQDLIEIHGFDAVIGGLSGQDADST